MKTKMPGKSFSGDLPPLTEEEIEISRRLRVHVGVLAGEIGERNIWKPDALKAAAQYVEQSLADLGLACGRQEYELPVSAFNAPATCLVDFQARASRARRRTGAGLRQVELLKRLKTQEAIAGRSQMTTAAICTPLL